MEVGDHHAEAAVLWLAHSILWILFAGKMEAWIRRVGLDGDTEALRSELERVEAVVPDAKGRPIPSPNRPLARSLGRLKELLYDADDMVHELDYYRLQHQVQGGTIDWDNQPQGTDVNCGSQPVGGSRDSSGMPSRNQRKKRSKAWQEFSIIEEDADGRPVKAECIHCGTQVRCETTKGTLVLQIHLNSDSCKRKRAANERTPSPSSAAATIATQDSDSKKTMRTGEVSARSPATNTDPWNKAEFGNGIQQMTLRLNESINEVQKMYGSSSVASSNLCQNTAADPCRRTSSLVQCKMFGREAEKNSIIKHVTGDSSNGVTIIPIVGIGGIGKTALAQIIYNDPVVKGQFDLRMWIWVSSNFDQVRITREMLDFVSQENHAGISSLAKLQEILVSHVTSKRCLIVLDDVWNDMDDHAWNKFLAPMQPNNEKSNVILVTTRKLSTTNVTGTIEPVKLGALQDDDFWLLFKRCSFGDDNHEGHPSLNIIGQQIVKKLYGSPLAAVSVGMLLRVNLTVDHWSNILNNEKWKSLHLNNGIMCSLKLSFDELPYYLQQCLLCCSIFPKNYQFHCNELIYIWIAQGFVKCGHSTEVLEETGQGYITDLVNSCFFEPVHRFNQCYVMPALVHDFARLVSRTECAALDGLDSNDIPPTVRHLSVLTDSAYRKDQHGRIPRNIKFEEKLRSVATLVRKLRTLVLIGNYDPFFFQSFQYTFNKARCLRALQISATYAEFDSFLHNSENSTHLHYLKLENKGSSESLPIPLSKFYHLQVLDVGHFFSRECIGPVTAINHMSDLVSMRHLVIRKGTHFMDPNSTCLEMTQLESMNELVHLGVHQLENVNGAEACGAKLREKQLLESLHLSWKGILTSEQFTDTAKEVLEGLEPHQNLKHLRISGYSGATSPNWFSSIVLFTCLQTLHLEDCGEWQVLPSLERLPFLTKLELRNMSTVTQVSIPPLEELELSEMPNLERCSCSSTRDLNSSLRVLRIWSCDVLKDFPLFDSCEKFGIERKSWLSGLSKLIIYDCPVLVVSNPLPPSSSTCTLFILMVSTLPPMDMSSNDELVIGTEDADYEEYCSELTELDDKNFSFHNLRALTRLKIVGCNNLSFISLEGFKQLISLVSLEICSCWEFFSSDVLPEQVHEDTATTNVNAFPALKHLSIRGSRISGKWLSVMLRHAPALEELQLGYCFEISGLLIEGKESCLSDHNSSPRASSAGNPDDASTSSTREGVVYIPSNLVSSLKKLSIVYCEALTFLEEKASFSAFTSLEELQIGTCPKLISLFEPEDESNDHANWRCLISHSSGEPGIVELEPLEKQQLMSVNCLRKLDIGSAPDLESLKLDSYTKLEELIIQHFYSLHTIEGLQSLRGLRYLKVYGCPRLPLFLERLSGQVSELFPGLERLWVDDYSFLTTSFCKHLVSLQCLQLDTYNNVEGGLTGEQERALQHITTLKDLQFSRCYQLVDLPVCLHSLSSLKRLRIISCRSILSLPERGLPPSLEELEISDCREQLASNCRMLATSTLMVKIDGRYVN